MLCEATWDNLWAIKMVLRSFEFVSGLRVNLYGLSLDDLFLNASMCYMGTKYNSHEEEITALEGAVHDINWR